MLDDSKKLLILTAPSGAGKTTLVQHLLSVFPFLGFSISATTRKCRANEVEGINYYFKTPDEFRALIQEHAFAEYEEVYQDQYYGTLKSELDRLWSLNKTVVFDIDVKGASNLKKEYGANAFVLFIAPPSLEVLEQRLIARASEDERALSIRLSRVKEEMEYINKFDGVLVNDDLDLAKKEAETKLLKFVYPNALLFQ